MKTENQSRHKKLADCAQSFGRDLGYWFDTQARELPWRSETSVYRTVVSEFMLQQTQVVTVLPYFERWMKAFPDFQALAGASDEKVLKHWEGLGYYNRARNLKKLAVRWVESNEKPQTAEAWLAFPGVGPYTAAAIASLAFGEKSAVVDGNVVRVLSRLTADDTEFTDNGKSVKHFAWLAQELILQVELPGRHNEAMMELGATICQKANPQCLLCPVGEYCDARKTTNPSAYPVIRRKPSITRSVSRLWILQDDALLLYKKPDGARRLSGLYELPEVSLLDLEHISPEPILNQRRGIANELITESFFEASLSFKEKLSVTEQQGFRWISLQDLDEFIISGPHKKWIKKIINNLLKL